MAIKIFIVDDHKVVRAGLRALLGHYEIIQVVGESANAEDALQEIGRLSPDLALVDLRLPGMSGLDLCRRLKKSYPKIRTIILTSFVDENLMLDAVEAGVDGYVLKDVFEEELFQAIDTVVQGGVALNPLATRTLAAHFARLRQKEVSHQPMRQDALSKRDLEVLELIAKGQTNKQIAQQLHLSEGTVRNRISDIFLKLNVTRRSEAVAHYLKEYR